MCYVAQASEKEREWRLGTTGWFNRTLQKATIKYRDSVHGILRRSIRVGVLYLGLVAVLAFLFTAYHRLSYRMKTAAYSSLKCNYQSALQWSSRLP